MKSVLLYLFFLSNVVSGYNVLIAFPIASKSLHLLYSSLGLSLAERGHTVTLFTSFDPYVSHPNIKNFKPDDYTKYFEIDNLFGIKSYSMFLKLMVIHTENTPHNIWKTKEVWDLYERRNEYDAIIMSAYANDVLLPFLDGFTGQLILVSTPGIEYNAIAFSGNYLTPSVIPHLHLAFDEYMSFCERALNGLTFAFDIAFEYFVMHPKLTKSLQVYFPEFKDIREYYGRTTLTLINGHFSLDSPVPLLPNQIEIGTINARKPKPLPKDLQKVFDEASPEGIIYFSLGSFVPSKSIPRKYKDIFIEAFRRLPHTVIWRYDEDDLEFPSNVVRRSWLPQEDILGHPKTKVFISHCGNLGTQEAKFHGVPVLGVPIAFDQPRNAARMERKGYAVVVSWEELSVEKLLESIDILTKDNIYYDRMKNVSKIVQDQKDSPAERAAWWVEYVIRHDGAPHLRYAGQRLSFLQYIMVDVLAFWLAIFVVALLITHRVVKSLWRKCFGAKKTKKD